MILITDNIYYIEKKTYKKEKEKLGWYESQYSRQSDLLIIYGGEKIHLYVRDAHVMGLANAYKNARFYDNLEIHLIP